MLHSTYLMDFYLGLCVVIYFPLWDKYRFFFLTGKSCGKTGTGRWFSFHETLSHEPQRQNITSSDIYDTDMEFLNYKSIFTGTHTDVVTNINHFSCFHLLLVSPYDRSLKANERIRRRFTEHSCFTVLHMFFRLKTNVQFHWINQQQYAVYASTSSIKFSTATIKVAMSR